MPATPCHVSVVASASSRQRHPQVRILEKFMGDTKGRSPTTPFERGNHRFHRNATADGRLAAAVPSNLHGGRDGSLEGSQALVDLLLLGTTIWRTTNSGACGQVINNVHVQQLGRLTRLEDGMAGDSSTTAGQTTENPSSLPSQQAAARTLRTGGGRLAGAAYPGTGTLTRHAPTARRTPGRTPGRTRARPSAPGPGPLLFGMRHKYDRPPAEASTNITWSANTFRGFAALASARKTMAPLLRASIYLLAGHRHYRSGCLPIPSSSGARPTAAPRGRSRSGAGSPPV
eukprot:SAG22_NODE_4_length_44774_cov_362.122149_28_plen_287_part_00